MSFRRDPKLRPSLTHILRPVRYTMKYSRVNTLASLLPVLFAYVRAETHTVVLDNRCNFGTPVLIGSDGTLLSEGGNFTINGPSEPVLIAFLKTRMYIPEPP
ncbi:hypothetical protein QCA50_009038 [Cerrena zonata]|uniref:Uncharacterized protein n=1 Tax=Cerrena zonata TaxID=2478898 RepID=A0AAW0GCG2_9APHY